ncbi:hypothetical protein HZH66_007516 [Vespula vulgaris]|uniref:Uncharacterized protein n=1 Tax=Vespula vulgaris TaxID=7454 RepID=A0A834JXU1_VESVU|nr:hypothetical protein HZH66_007516 [Vespula vulgaris]
MKSESNNGYIRANVIPEQNELTSPTGQDVSLTGSPLQIYVNYRHDLNGIESSRVEAIESFCLKRPIPRAVYNPFTG